MSGGRCVGINDARRAPCPVARSRLSRSHHPIRSGMPLPLPSPLLTSWLATPTHRYANHHADATKSNAMDAYSRADVKMLLERFPHGLAVAYLQRVGDRFFSCVVDGTRRDASGQLESDPDHPELLRPTYRIELPGFPVLGNGKSDNQNMAIPYTRGPIIQVSARHVPECRRAAKGSAPPVDLSLLGPVRHHVAKPRLGLFSGGLRGRRNFTRLAPSHTPAGSTCLDGVPATPPRSLCSVAPAGDRLQSRGLPGRVAQDLQRPTRVRHLPPGRRTPCHRRVPRAYLFKPWHTGYLRRHR